MRALLLVGVLAAAVSTSAAAQAPDGKVLYNELCKKCHGALGTPTKPMATKFPKMLAFNNEKAETSKGTLATVMNLIVKGKGEDMKPFGAKLNVVTPAKDSPEAIAVAKYVLELAKSK